MTAKTEILGRIRAALGARTGARVEEYHAVPRRYRQSSVLGAEARLDLFLSRIQHYDGGVFRCDVAAIPETIGRALSDRAKRRVVVPSGLSREWLPDGF